MIEITFKAEDVKTMVPYLAEFAELFARRPELLAREIEIDTQPRSLETPVTYGVSEPAIKTETKPEEIDTVPTTQAAPAPEEKHYSLEEIRAAGINAARAYGRDAVKQILTELQAASMTELDPSNYAVFMERIGELSA